MKTIKASKDGMVAIISGVVLTDSQVAKLNAPENQQAIKAALADMHVDHKIENNGNVNISNMIMYAKEANDETMHALETQKHYPFLSWVDNLTLPADNMQQAQDATNDDDSLSDEQQEFLQNILKDLEDDDCTLMLGRPTAISNMAIYWGSFSIDLAKRVIQSYLDTHSVIKFD